MRKALFKGSQIVRVLKEVEGGREVKEVCREHITVIGDANVDAGIEISAWCFVPNHVHLIVVPEHLDSLSA